MPRSILGFIQWQFKGFNSIKYVNSVKELLLAIQRDKFNVIIIDSELEPIKKLELIKHLSEEINCSTIAMFNYDEYRYTPIALSYGAVSCIMKPYSPLEVEQALERAAAPSKKNKAYKGQKLSAATYLIELIVKYIDENYSGDIGLVDIATRFYISPNYLCSVFKKETNIPLNSYIKKIRVEKARLCLLESDMPINDISRKVGFKASKHFYGSFKKYFVLTPFKYRKIYKA